MSPSSTQVSAIADVLENSAALVIRQLMDRSELNNTASDVLHRIETEGPARLTSLAAAVAVSQPSMTQLVQRLERQGIVRRTRDPNDGRGCLVSITDVGRAIVRQRRCRLRQRLTELLTTLSADDLAALELACHVLGPVIATLNRDGDAGRRSARLVTSSLTTPASTHRLSRSFIEAAHKV